ncbi:branched-chain amino acid ABC transporter permease [Halosegnis marinus]|uniref:Branched-chain amino acid ABC transporter permease n=1 Tax=Halosegnis marinus TaxID=3034023 RepID=A0ABD5ZRU8_9EURY|nr:branched-chain amino acid ABC transporter permease [Halosegnis sp. DT85]
MSDDARTDGGTATADPNLVDRLVAAKHSERFVAVVSLVGLLAMPFLLIDVLGVFDDLIGVGLGGFVGLPTLILAFGIVAVGYNLLLGYTGLLSFGHAALFGAAAYAAGIFSNEVVASPVLAILVGVVAATLLAWPIGFLSIRRSGVYFAVLTLTFGQMLYFYAFGPGAWLTNGDDGYTPFAVPGGAEIAGAVPTSDSLSDLFFDLTGLTLTLTDGLDVTVGYVLTALIGVAAIVTAHRIIKSPYGLILKAIGQNEQRVAFIGMDVFRYKLMAFVLSGVFAGAGGGIYALSKAGLTVHPNATLYWIVSGDFVIMTALGGVGSLAGPLLGAVVFEYIALVVQGITIPIIDFQIGSLWRLLLGLAFVLVVAFFPDGIYGALSSLGERIAERFGTESPTGDGPRPVEDVEETGGDD